MAAYRSALFGSVACGCAACGCAACGLAAAARPLLGARAAACRDWPRRQGRPHPCLHRRSHASRRHIARQRARRCARRCARVCARRGAHLCDQTTGPTRRVREAAAAAAAAPHARPRHSPPSARRARPHRARAVHVDLSLAQPERTRQTMARKGDPYG
eukprot:6193714-Pleurochrysis_carterae.AAC.1